MTPDERLDAIKIISNKVQMEGVRPIGYNLSLEEILIYPDIAKALFGTHEIRARAYNMKVPAWREHQHQLLDFLQTYNPDEALRYVLENLNS